jgi:hypothetical protein
MVYDQSGIPFWGGGEMTVRKKRDSGIKKEYAAALNHEYSRTTCSMPN